MDTNTQIGIVGLGIMSSGMTEHFLKNGYTVHVWNRTQSKSIQFEEQGANVCETPAEVANRSDIIFEVTANDESSREVWTNPETGILKGASSTDVLIASSTLSVEWVDELASLCSKSNFTFFDMPLTGGRIGAETGSLTMLVGGDNEKLEQLRPILDAIAGKVFYFGPAGHGTRYKLLLNMLQGIHLSAYGEVMKIAEQANMDIEAVGKALVDRPGGVSTTIAHDCYKNQPDPVSFSVKWITKDLGYAQELSDKLETPLLDAAHNIFNSALESGHGESDFTIVNEPK